MSFFSSKLITGVSVSHSTQCRVLFIGLDTSEKVHPHFQNSCGGDQTCFERNPKKNGFFIWESFLSIEENLNY